MTHTDLFQGELMSIQPAEEGYYVEIPAFGWSRVYPDYSSAFSAALAAIEEYKEGELAKLTGGIQRILEYFFGADTPVKGHCRIGIKPYKDVDGDGDMDIRYSITQSRYRSIRQQ